MWMWHALVVAALTFGAPTPSQSPRITDRGRPLTAQDRSDLELLSARYSWALGTCNAQTWPDLFVPDGYFTSGSRGKVQGRKKLAEMIRSYNCVYSADGVAPPHAPGVIVPYKLEIEPSPDGATGKAYYNGGRYEDAYVRTADGWRFKSRTVVTNQELAANLTAADFDEIQRLATANGGPFVDVYERIPGGSRFQSTGVVITPAPDGATGTAYLKDGGHYEDTYVKTSEGWRVKSRVHVNSAAAQSGSSPPPRAEPAQRERSR
jgi:SnoaL-like domain